MRVPYAFDDAARALHQSLPYGVVRPEASDFPITVEIEYDPGADMTVGAAAQPNLMFTFLEAGDFHSSTFRLKLIGLCH